MILLLNIICACFTSILCKEHLLRGVQPSSKYPFIPNAGFYLCTGPRRIDHKTPPGSSVASIVQG